MASIIDDSASFASAQKFKKKEFLGNK